MVISACKPAEAPPAAQLEEEEEEGGGLARLTAFPVCSRAVTLRSGHGGTAHEANLRLLGEQAPRCGVRGGGAASLYVLVCGLKWQ